MDDFIESFQWLSLTVRMPSQNRIMLELSGRLSRDSNLRKYLAAPPALHSVSSFENAEELFILSDLEGPHVDAASCGFCPDFRPA